MFFSSPSMDLKITVFLTILVFLVSLVIFLFSKKKLLSFFVFSLLTNIVFLAQSILGSLIFRIYNIIWIQKLSNLIWPMINIFLFIVLIFLYVKKNKK
jgi:cell shape-determining protein MreD